MDRGEGMAGMDRGEGMVGMEAMEGIAKRCGLALWPCPVVSPLNKDPLNAAPSAALNAAPHDVAPRAALKEPA